MNNFLSEKDVLPIPDLFEKPIATRYVRAGVVAYKYRNGVININGEKFIDYSMTDAVKIWRSKNKMN